ncbi:hypothetical protein ANO14919_045110 [Xylariales sp. No.14919]|nr:hypothetical protein ANO14919_045110 [Xylariales sp. No.14919]
MMLDYGISYKGPKPPQDKAFGQVFSALDDIKARVSKKDDHLEGRVQEVVEGTIKAGEDIDKKIAEAVAMQRDAFSMTAAGLKGAPPSLGNLTLGNVARDEYAHMPSGSKGERYVSLVWQYSNNCYNSRLYTIAVI